MRRVFNYDNTKEAALISQRDPTPYARSVTAAGCVFRKGTRLLLIRYASSAWPLLDDLGGKADVRDTCIEDTIAREVREETNGVITEDLVRAAISQCAAATFYNARAKYYGLVVDVDNDFFPDSSVFGTHENTDKIERTVSWYEYAAVRDKLCVRLASCEEFVACMNATCATDAVAPASQVRRGTSSATDAVAYASQST